MVKQPVLSAGSYLIISFLIKCFFSSLNNNNCLRPFVRDYPSEPVPEETLTHPPSFRSSCPYHHDLFCSSISIISSIPSLSLNSVLGTTSLKFPKVFYRPVKGKWCSGPTGVYARCSCSFVRPLNPWLNIPQNL